MFLSGQNNHKKPPSLYYLHVQKITRPCNRGGVYILELMYKPVEYTIIDTFSTDSVSSWRDINIGGNATVAEILAEKEK
jgi:hypothetical protein